VSETETATLSVELHPTIREWDAKATHVTTPLARGKMVWRRWGSGPPIVLVHGGSGSWTHWIRNIGPLAQHYTVWAIDLPGHGDSDACTAEDLKLLPGEEPDFVESVKPEWQPQPIPMPPYARIVARSIETIIPEGKISIVCFSFGGIVSSNVAALIPHRTSQVILCGAAGLAHNYNSRPRVPMVSWRFADTPEKIAEVQRRNVAILMLRDPAHVDDLALNVQITNTERTQARKPRRRGSTLEALRKAHEAAGVRIDAIWGEFDPTSSYDIEGIEARLRAVDPDMQFHIIKNSGHWVAYEFADQFNAILLDLLKSRDA
jgi:2-hydroxy-6-oxonona-2,4-dienedioate hydrolase